MIVELDIFSGRPNPRWELDGAARRELLALEAGLKPAAADRGEPPPLGYRGFVYAEGGIARRAFHGRLERAAALLDDPGRAIERYLLASMPAQWQPMKGRIEAELGLG